MAKSHWHLTLSAFGLCVALIVASPVVAAQAKYPAPSTEPPVLTIRAKEIGYRVSDFRNFHPKVGGDAVKILFLDSHRVAFAWLALDTSR